MFWASSHGQSGPRKAGPAPAPAESARWDLRPPSGPARPPRSADSLRRPTSTPLRPVCLPPSLLTHPRRVCGQRWGCGRHGAQHARRRRPCFLPSPHVRASALAWQHPLRFRVVPDGCGFAGRLWDAGLLQGKPLLAGSASGPVPAASLPLVTYWTDAVRSAARNAALTGRSPALKGTRRARCQAPVLGPCRSRILPADTRRDVGACPQV